MVNMELIELDETKKGAMLSGNLRALNLEKEMVSL